MEVVKDWFCQIKSRRYDKPRLDCAHVNPDLRHILVIQR